MGKYEKLKSFRDEFKTKMNKTSNYICLKTAGEFLVHLRSFRGEGNHYPSPSHAHLPRWLHVDVPN